jgi:hypothetical protein
LTKTVTSTGSPCVALTLTPLSTTAFTGVFTPAVVGSSRIVTYSITTYSNSDCSTAISGSTVSYVNPTQNSLSYSVTSGLTTATTYYVRMSVAIGGNAATTCTVQTIKTL